MVSQVSEADYLVVGAGAAGMAFTDALIANADVSIAVVDRRHNGEATGWTALTRTPTPRNPVVTVCSSTNGGRLSLQIADEWSDTRLTDDLISKPDSALGVDRAGVGGRSGRHGHRLGVE